MSAPQQSNKSVYNLTMFLLVSVLSGLILSGFVVPGVAMAGMAGTQISDSLSELPKDLEVPPLSEGSKIKFEDGTIVADLFKENRINVPFSKIAQSMKDAQLAVEDKRFYEHGALDPKGFARALLSGGGAGGGSSITQQVVKLTRLEVALTKGDEKAAEASNERTIARKFQELRYAVAMEKKLSKEQIFERYLNIAYYGGGTYGVESAAQHFFNTSADKLTIAQSAMLAGMVQNPWATDPNAHPEANNRRRNLVLYLLYDQKKITKEQYEEAKAVKFDFSKVEVKRNDCANSKYPHICDYAKYELLQNKALGADVKSRESALYRGGYTFVLTINRQWQDKSVAEMVKYAAPKDPMVAVMNSVQPGTGKILIMAQNRSVMGGDEEAGEAFQNYSVGWVDGSWGGFQHGSTFKIFAVAAALDKGIPPTTRINSPALANYSPSNLTILNCQGQNVVAGSFPMPNHESYAPGTIDMYHAAAQSVNNYFIPLAGKVGNCAMEKMAEATGAKLSFQTYNSGNANDKPALWGKAPAWDDGVNSVPTFVLGTSYVNSLSMVNAYATFAARGKRCDPYIVEKMITREGKQLPGTPHQCVQAIKPELADGVTAVMKAVTAKGGSGAPTALAGYDTAGKTGTTDFARDLLYIGYSPDAALLGLVSADRASKKWPSYKLQGEAKMGLKGWRRSDGNTFQGSAYYDIAQTFYTPVWHDILRSTPGNRFNRPGDEMLVGKLVDLPVLTGTDPNRDEQILKDAGFQVDRKNVPAFRPPGTYLGPEQTGRVPQGTTVTLKFSSGPKRGDDPSEPIIPGLPGIPPGDGND